MSVLYWQRTVAKQASRGATPGFVQLVDETSAAFLPKWELMSVAARGIEDELDAALPDGRRFVIKLIRARLSLGRAQQYSAVAQWQSIRLLTEGL